MSEVIGVKHDGGKPWAGTVLAGFWPQLRGYFRDQASDVGDLDDELQGWCDVLDMFFDVSIAIPDRIVNAAKHLTDHVSADAYLTHVIDVGTYGARKYDRDNWLHVEGGVARYYEAVGRHVRDVMLGDWLDEESGCVNLGHIAWGILAGAELVRRSAYTPGSVAAAELRGTRETVAGQDISKGQAVSMADDGKVYVVTDGRPAPKLKLPIEEGKTYIVTYADGKADAGTASFERVSSEGAPLFAVAGWLVRGLDGSVPGTTHRVEGPVEP
jgi:hypothetical protein